ncbi:hypothetical protein HPP92_018834 [Vanilla planifolia]|uniref:threonine ammonia-lyase n=1 Tax=Vanilla planifolia TaxID=51239 RepID=A0A835Q7R1_VANPL|nr:hypothetical protein HPP92_018834 [Vanilla planifolia]
MVISGIVTLPWKSVQDLGATVVLKGDSYDEAQLYAKQRAIREDRTFVPPFDHRDVISGQGTIGLEIIRQTTGPLHAIFVPVGGGGLIAGIAAYTKSVCPEVKVIGVEPFDANAMALSLHSGGRVMLERGGGFADGVAVKAGRRRNFFVQPSLVDGVVLVDRDAICASMKVKNCCTTSGANMNFDRLRLVNRTCRRSSGEKQFLRLICTKSLEVSYNFANNVGIHTVAELEDMLEQMEDARLRTICLTNNALAKDHLRHLMGGRSDVKSELMFRFVLPERPGVLMEFLNAFSPRWNISLFHYRSQKENISSLPDGRNYHCREGHLLFQFYH